MLQELKTKDALQKFLEGKEILVMHCEQGFEKSGAGWI